MARPRVPLISRRKALEAALQIIRAGGSSVASFNMKESDIEAFMKQPWVMTCSDGSEGHPRKYGTFPRKIHEYVYEKHVLSLEAAVRSSTSLLGGGGVDEALAHHFSPGHSSSSLTPVAPHVSQVPRMCPRRHVGSLHRTCTRFLLTGMNAAGGPPVGTYAAFSSAVLALM